MVFFAVSFCMEFFCCVCVCTLLVFIIFQYYLFVRSFIMVFYFMCPRLMCASYVCNPKMVINLLKTNFKANAPKTRSKCVLLRMCNEHSDPSIQFQIFGTTAISWPISELYFQTNDLFCSFGFSLLLLLFSDWKSVNINVRNMVPYIHINALSHLLGRAILFFSSLFDLLSLSIFEFLN